MKLFRAPKYSVYLFVVLIIVYLITHLWGLARLPVFADEAIYIRWSQLILDDPGRYYFFAMNDGKTPLFIWQLVPFVKMFADPLFGARLLSVVGGLVQLVAIVALIRELKGGWIAQMVGAFFVTLLPFWFFHHRMALMDGWLSVWLTWSLVFLLRSIRTESWKWAVLAGVSLGAGFLTKLPAVLLLPSLVILSSHHLVSGKNWKMILGRLVITIGIGVALFGSLKISAAFPQLFSRGGDFLFPASDVMNGVWLTTIKNIPSYLDYFWQYATPAVVGLVVLSLFVKENRRRNIILVVSFLAYCLPIALMGKVVFPRYLFPGMIFLTTLAALTAEELFYSKNERSSLSSIGLVTISLVSSLLFIVPAIYNPNNTPFVSADSGQYLTEWSSGHGVREVRDRLLAESQTQTIAVATEGYFGTLPDALLMYLHNQNVNNIAVEGIGQPVNSIPQYLIDKAGEYDRQWLVVNSHRRTFELPPNTLLASYCRPFNAPCLELWDVTDVINSLPNPVE